MPRFTTDVPKLCHDTRGQAFVKIDGRQIWLGHHGEPLTQEKYDRLMPAGSPTAGRCLGAGG